MTKSVEAQLDALDHLIESTEASRIALVNSVETLIAARQDSATAWRDLREIEDRLAALRASRAYLKARNRTP